MVNKECVLELQTHFLFKYRHGSPWFSSMATKTQMLVGSPKSVLDEFNTSDDFYSLSDKECHKSNSNKQKQLKNEDINGISNLSGIHSLAKLTQHEATSVNDDQGDGPEPLRGWSCGRVNRH